MKDGILPSSLIVPKIVVEYVKESWAKQRGIRIQVLLYVFLLAFVDLSQMQL